jgi:predicted amidohydrolase YtcJ
MGVKFYADGALGSRGALLERAYADAPETKGLQLMSRDEALTAYRIAHDAGLQVATHAIGDRGNALVIDWYSEVIERGEDHRWRIEHAQILRPSDIPRFAFWGIIPSMQPSHAIGDLKFAPARLGDNRLLGAYAWGRLTDTGARVVGGSDAPVERGDPRIELHAASRRFALDGFEADNWHQEERLDPDETLALFTTNAAYAVRLEDELGRIAEGLRADLTIFSADPFMTPWSDVEIVDTYVEGEPSGR